MLAIDLTGKRALVTGGTGELGREICRTLWDAGAEVAFTYFSQADAAERLAQELDAAAFRADVRLADEVNAVARELGRVDIVVANAVVQYDWKPILDQPIEDFDSQYQSCVLQLVHLAKAFAPGMREAGGGRFVAINTECAIVAGAGMGAYASAKRGLDGIVRVLAKELGPDGITVNQVAPGWIESEKYRKDGSDAHREYREKVPMKRTGSEEDIANAVAFLASDLAGFVTGAFLPVCGGNAMVSI